MNTRIGVRMSNQLRERMEQAVNSGHFKNKSDLIRQAVEKFLKEVD